MALIYPVLADAPEPDDGAAPDVAELAADLSDQWLVEVAVGEDGDDACFGPLAAGMRGSSPSSSTTSVPTGTISVVPLYVAEPADQIISLFEEE